MFHHIEGKVSELGAGYAVIECGGLGFWLNTSLNTLSQLKTDQICRLYISEVVKEDAFDLYGFYSRSERRCFEMLTSVSGIGPKVALSILSGNTPEGLALAVMNNNEKALTGTPGIGKEIAQRIILELKDKIGKESEEIGVPAPVVAMPVGDDRAVNDAVAALTVLGYGSSDIAPALKQLDLADMKADEIIKAVLKQMVK